MWEWIIIFILFIVVTTAILYAIQIFFKKMELKKLNRRYKDEDNKSRRTGSPRGNSEGDSPGPSEEVISGERLLFRPGELERLGAVSDEDASKFSKYKREPSKFDKFK